MRSLVCVFPSVSECSGCLVQLNEHLLSVRSGDEVWCLGRNVGFRAESLGLDL